MVDLDTGEIIPTWPEAPPTYAEGPHRVSLHIVKRPSSVACFYFAPLVWNPTGVDKMALHGIWRPRS